ncbi:MAG: hypothetical protein KC917_07890, partial [Candidatus Omnitrophica bacterium]|nr:hypothetical protein [Candidatus Omnitrophota bacterium]
SVRRKNSCPRRNPMYKDEIIEELWKQREAYAAAHNHDLHAIVNDLLERQKKPLSRLVDRRGSKPERPANDISQAGTK